MLQRLLFAWQPGPTAITILFMLAMLGVGEYIAEQTRDGDFTGHSKGHHHVWFSTRSFSLPNYWVWYEKEAVHEAIEAQGLAINTFLISIVFNAAMGTPAVCIGLIFGMMFLAVRVLDASSSLNWCWLAPVIGFIFDLTEDFSLLIITLGYPFRQYPTLMTVLRYSSLFKFIAWLVSLSIMAVLGCVLLIKGRRKKDAAKLM